MKRSFRRALAAAAAAAVLTGSVAASGAVTKRSIDITYRNIRLVIDGVTVVPKDSEGNVVEPFIYEGTTYLPIRAVGGALGKAVSWDSNTNTVTIGTSTRLPYQVNEGEIYDGQDPNASFSVAGNIHRMGAVLHSFHAAPEDSRHDHLAFDGTAIWNTEGFQSMTFTIGHVGNFQRNAAVHISLDGTAVGKYDLRWDGSPQTITVPLNGSANVKLTLVAAAYHEPLRQNDAHDFAERYGIYDVTLS